MELGGGAWYAAFCVAAVVAVQVVAARAGGAGPAARRRAQHAASGVTIAVLAAATGERSRAFDASVLFGSCALLAAGHAARLRVPSVDRRVRRAFGSLLRPHEHTSLPAAFYFLLGCGLCAALFAKRVTVCAVLALAFGDPAASLAGARWGARSPRYRNGKTAAGTAAAVLAAGVAAGAAAAAYGERRAAAWAAVAGLAAGASEAVAAPPVDDNLAVPLAVGVALTAFFGVS